LTSNIAECKTVTADHGLTFKKGDAKDLAEKLQMLCDNPQTVENYKNKSAEYILNKYNWDDVTNKTLELYGKL
jgi:glycosyltransferase involved in cell wall biosynthesis